MAEKTDARQTRATTDHETIRKWVQDREGSPAAVERTRGADDPGLLRVDFPGYSGEESLVHLDWSEWFEKFDQAELAFLYQEETSEGERSNFNKLVRRETVKDQL